MSRVGNVPSDVDKLLNGENSPPLLKTVNSITGNIFIWHTSLINLKHLISLNLCNLKLGCNLLLVGYYISRQTANIISYLDNCYLVQANSCHCRTCYMHILCKHYAHLLNSDRCDWIWSAAYTWPYRSVVLHCADSFVGAPRHQGLPKESGKKWITFAKVNKQCIINTLF